MNDLMNFNSQTPEFVPATPVSSSNTLISIATNSPTTMLGIKKRLGFGPDDKMPLSISTDAEGNPVLDDNGKCWYQMWDNVDRIRVALHQDTLSALKAQGDLPMFGLKVSQSVSESTGEAYTKVIIVAYKGISESF